MGKLSDWCASQPDWAVDAMQRAGSCSPNFEADVNALVCRIGLAHGLTIDGDHPCQPFAEESIVVADLTPDDVVLHSVGPLQGLDRLADDQVLKFALNGMTIVFGDNGSGKSGYTRALRQLTCVREEAPLEGDVFAVGSPPHKSITYKYRVGEGDAVTAVWAEGEAKPAVLGGVTLLDTDNLRVYVSGKSDILYMPPEAACVGRLADLYQAAADRYREWIDVASRRFAGTFGGHYTQGTTAAGLVAQLQAGTAEASLPTEQSLREAASWDPNDEAHLANLQAELVQGPGASAALYDRIAISCLRVATALEATTPLLLDEIVAGDAALLEATHRTRRVADALAAEQIGSQPIAATGSDTWRELFSIARQFAVEAGVRRLGEPFAVGDPCPLCQQSLDADAVVRLAAFDAYVEGAAMRAAELASTAMARRVSALRDLSFKSEGEIRSLLAEAADTQGAPAQALVDRTVRFSAELEARRAARVRQFNDAGIAAVEPLSASPIADLKSWATQLSEYAATLRSGDDRSAATTAMIAELTGRKQMSGQLDELIARRSELKTIYLWRRCEAALNTAPLSRLMTSLRKELTTPGLKARIEEEVHNLALSHIPLQFADETSKGTSFFEMALVTSKKAKKARVLSEGEQRALSLACFLAESHVAGKKSGIILDDPVTSLDHGRVRRVARRLVDEAGKGRQIVVFTHNLVFYNELMLACTDRADPVPALPCLIRQGGGRFGLVSVGDEPWVARKVKQREQTLNGMINDISNDLDPSTDDYGRKCTAFYAALRETWERAVEEVVLNDVVRRFGTDVGTRRLGGVEVTDDDFMLIERAMSRASEHSGHDQAAGRQIDTPTKAQMHADLEELTAFRAAKEKRIVKLASHRRALTATPPRATVG